jgi:RNA polymerase sigma-70 factor (ECF subfamily)
MTSGNDVTRLLLDWANGNQRALDELMPLVYSELHRMATRYMATAGAGHTLQPTALLHEAYCRLAGNPGRNWQNRTHFFRLAAKVMRHIMIDHARAQLTTKRGGDQHEVALDEGIAVSGERLSSLVALDDALRQLQHLNQRQAEVVEMRFFGGLTVAETAEALATSPKTVMRDWRAAKAWLHLQLSKDKAASGAASDT